METIKTTGLILIISLSSLLSNAQDYKKTIDAFQNSYLHEASGNLAESILVLKEVYEESSYELNLRLGWLTYSSGLFSESNSYYNKAVLLKPFAIEPRFGIVLPLAALGNWDAVLTHYNKMLEISPNNSIVLHRLGLIYYGQKDYLKAEKYFEKVVNLYPFDYDALVMYAWTKYYLNKVREAKVLFNKALMNTPSGASAMQGIELMNK